MLKTCEYCGKEFNAHHSKQKFCSTLCQHEARRKTHVFECQHCGKSFKSKAKNKKFCSTKCYHESQRKIINAFCDYCGKPITFSPSQEKYYQNHFCSNECSAKFRSNKNSKKVLCSYCGKEIKIKNSIDRTQKQHFCDENCYYQYKRTINKNNYILHDTYAEIIVKSPKYGTFYPKIDLEDVEKCKQYYWKVRNCKQGIPYFYASIPKKKSLHLHRYIMNCPADMVVDHINTYDHLDNRKSNLRVTDISTNVINRKQGSNNTSGYKNISYDKNCDMWVVLIQKYKKVLLRKKLKTLAEAVALRDKFIEENRDIY